jgi:hypothetical protein
MAISGHNGQNESFIGNSSSYEISFYDENANEIQISQSNLPIDIKIKRDPSLLDSTFSFQYVNSTEINNALEALNSIFLPSTFRIKSKNASIHIEIKPLIQVKSYLIALKFGYMPIINSTYSDYDSFRIYCPSKNLVSKMISLSKIIIDLLFLR